MRLSEKAKKAVFLGSLCVVAYLSVYIARGVLSAATPQITQSGAFSTEQIGTLSSICFAVYAVGQLVNGVIGDKVKGRNMISFGLIFSSIGFLLLPQLTHLPGYAYIAYGSTGFFMAMIYGPMTKVVAENTEPIYTTRCSVSYNMASYLGSPIAGVMASVMTWPWVFRSSGILLLAMGVVAFVCFLGMEKSGMVKYGQYDRPKGSGGSVRVLLKRKIVKFTLVAILTGVVRTSVVFWMPAYISQRLAYPPETATLIFSVASTAFAFSTVLALLLYNWLKRDLGHAVPAGFAISAVCFLLVFFVKSPMLNVVCMSIAILGNNMSSSMLWNYYCPSLYDTGKVSSATGFLDACSYLAAAVSSQMFANAAETIGWSALVLVWAGLMLCGIVVSLPWKKR